MRLSVFLAKSGVASRRQAEKFIADGLVSVNGVTVTEQGTKVGSRDQVSFRGRPVCLEVKVIYLYHKPAGVVSTMSDPQGRKDMSEITSSITERVFPVGRLDIDVTGLLLFTNDGEYCQKLLHPSFQVRRRYRARVQGEISDAKLSTLRTGVSLEDGVGKFEVVQKKGEFVVELETTEGRNHFVKRMLKHVDLPVVNLKRLEFGPYKLGSVPKGELRQVDFLEI